MVERPRADRLARLLAGKEPALRPLHRPSSAQEIEQIRGEHDIAILALLALLEADRRC
jgi:hypothetical protein